MLTRAPLSGAILVSPGPKLHSVKTWGDAGGGVGEELPRIEQFAESVKASFTVDLSYLNYYNFYQKYLFNCYFFPDLKNKRYINVIGVPYTNRFFLN